MPVRSCDLQAAIISHRASLLQNFLIQIILLSFSNLFHRAAADSPADYCGGYVCQFIWRVSSGLAPLNTSKMSSEAHLTGEPTRSFHQRLIGPFLECYNRTDVPFSLFLKAPEGLICIMHFEHYETNKTILRNKSTPYPFPISTFPYAILFPISR